MLVVLSVFPVAPARADTTTTLNDCPSNSGGYNFAAISSDYAVNTPAPGTTMTWSLTTPNKLSSGGIPGVIELCVYPNNMGDVSGQSTSAVGADSSSWTASVDCGGPAPHNCVMSQRSDGDPSNIPDNGGTTANALTITFNAAPSSYTVVLHINDAAECAALFPTGASDTCFVLPIGYIFPPPPSSALTTTVVDEGPGSFVAGDSFHDTATLTVSGDSGAAPNGMVTYYFYATGTCTSLLTSNYELVGGTAASPTVGNSISEGPLSAGPYSFQAVYDGNYGTVTSACEPFTVTTPPPTVPQFPFGPAAIFALLVPALLLLRKKIVPLI